MTNEIRLKIVVDGKEANAEIQLTDENIRELYKSFKYGKQEVNGFTTKISMGFNNAREIIQGATEVARVFQQTFGKSIQLYGVQEQAEKQLASALGYTSQVLLDYASAMQKVTTHGDEEIIQAQSLIAAFVKDEDQIKQLTKATLDLADAKGMDLRTAADLLTKSVASNTNALSRYGIEIEGAAGSSERLQSAIDAVDKAFGGQAEALAETNIGKLKQFENLLGDVQEKAGGLIVDGLRPIVEELSKFFNNLDKVDSQLSGVIASIGMFGGAVAMLQTTGILPLIIDLGKLKNALTLTRVSFATASETSTISAAGFRASGVAAKGFFTAIGPVGWAVLGLTALVEIVNLLSSSTSDLSEQMTEQEKDLRVQQKEFQQLTNKIADNNSSLEERKKALAELQSKYPGYLKNLNLERMSQAEVANAIKKANDEMERSVRLKVYREKYEQALRKEVEIEEQIKKKREEIVEISKDQSSIGYYSGVNSELNKANNELAELIQKLTQAKKETSEWEEKIRESDKSLKSENKSLNTIDERVKEIKKEIEEKKNAYFSLSPEEAEKAKPKFQKEIAKLQSELNKYELTIKMGAEADDKTLGLIGEIEKQINSLREQKMFAKSEEELVSIEKKIQELENKKALIELRVKLKAEGKDLDDFSELDKKPSVSVNIPVHLDTVSAAEDFQELQDMKFASMENEFERERAMLDAQYQADLEKYKDVIGAKEILDEYYTKRKQELSRVATETEIQNTLQALNFIGAAVNQYTAVGKGIAMANAIWNTYLAATKALASAPPPFNYILMAGVVAAGMAQVEHIAEAEPPKMPKFAKGGRLPEGEAGFVEGWYNELIAPEKDFIQIFQQELRPKIYAELGAQNIAVQNGKLVRKIDELNKNLLERPLKANVSIDKVTARQIVKVGNNEISKET